MDTQKIRRVTVRQLTSMPQPAVPTETFTLVGTLTFVPGSTTSWLFDLGDTTGILRGSLNCMTNRVVEDLEERIRQESNQAEEYDVGPPPWTDARYYRVWGMMTGGVFEALGMRPLSDMNELTMHMLECVYEHCVNKSDKQ